MAGKLKGVADNEELEFPDAKNYSIGIVVSEYHSDICEKLKRGAIDNLLKFGVSKKRIKVVYVPGAYEIPLAARWMYDSSDDFDAIICLGCVIKGETNHDAYINDAIAKKLMEMSVEDDIPFVFGVLTVNNQAQAEDRAGGKLGNKGEECAISALKMIALKDSIID